MKVDYIIVGLGLAGIAFVEEVFQANKTCVVYENKSQTSSLVAGGVYNPVILKRFTPVWNAPEQLATALPFYTRLEEKLGTQFDYRFPTKRVFKSIEEQNNWFIAADKPLLAPFLNPSIHKNTSPGLCGEYGLGEVFQTGRVDTHRLVSQYQSYLESLDAIRYTSFEYDQLVVEETQLSYEDLTASHIVFCEGYGLVHNPYFNYLPLQGTKGELITIHAPDLNVDFLVKSSLFILPLGNDHYKVGATFHWTDKTSEPTEEGRASLVEKLETMISVPYTIIAQTAGVRPTVIDRRPLVGVHPEHSTMAVLNGLGTRGVMLAPTMAKELFNHLEHQQPLDPEIDINRF